MVMFSETEDGKAFIASGDARETSPEIMEAIAFFARNADEAERLWDGSGVGTICTRFDMWERVTKNGAFFPSEFNWGGMGSHWWSAICSEAE